MDLQSLLCGFGADNSRNINLQMPKLRRLQEFRRKRFHKNKNASKVGPHSGRNRAARRHLPVGRGIYTVGCLDVMSDYDVSGTFIRLYYPTNAKDVYKREVQWPLWLPRKQYGHGYVYFRRMTKVFGTILNWVGGDVYVPVLWHAPVIDNGCTFPVIIITHGLGGNRTTYSTLCCDLASHGFIVAAIEHRDGTASMTYTFKEPNENNVSINLVEYTSDSESSGSLGAMGDSEEEPPLTPIDPPHMHHQHTTFREQWRRYDRQEKEDDFEVRNKQVYMRVDEIKRTLDLLEAINSGKEVRNVLGVRYDLRQLKGCMDMDRVSLVGHSFGGASTIATLAHDKRFKCGVALDSWMLPLDDSIYRDMDLPLLLVNMDTFQWSENVRDMYRLGVNGQQDRTLLTVKGTCHQNVSDFQFVVPGHLARLLEMRHTLSPKVALHLINDATLGFLHKHLNIPDGDHHDNILKGDHRLIVYGTNLDLEKDE